MSFQMKIQLLIPLINNWTILQMLNTWGDAVLVNQPMKCWLLVDFEGLLCEAGACMALG